MVEALWVPVNEARLDRSPLIVAVADIARGSWDRCFQNDVLEGASFIVARALALVGPGTECVISFGRVPISDITERNPLRVSATSEGGYPLLRSRLSTDHRYDAVPLSLGRSSRGTAVWDGHRRLETYRAAGRADVPAWIATFRRGAGLIRVG